MASESQKPHCQKALANLSWGSSSTLNTTRTNSFGGVQNKTHVLLERLLKDEFSRESAVHILVRKEKPTHQHP